MTKFVENVNVYMSRMKIKQTYLSLKSGMDTKKLSRILTGTQDISSADMEKLAKALGQRPEFFMQDKVETVDVSQFLPDKIAFYAGNPTQQQDEIAGKLEKLMENIDEVLSARYRFINISKES